MATDGKISLAVLAGDGIGPEITDATVRVLEAAAARSGLDLALTPYPVGWKAYEESRSTLMPETVAALRNHMGWILGPTFAGEYPDDDPIKGHPSGYLRRNFALFADVRPVQAWPQLEPLIGDLELPFCARTRRAFIRTAI
jgi:3-isopropylmalate dehydrogenase